MNMSLTHKFSTWQALIRNYLKTYLWTNEIKSRDNKLWTTSWQVLLENNFINILQCPILQRKASCTFSKDTRIIMDKNELVVYFCPIKLSWWANNITFNLTNIQQKYWRTIWEHVLNFGQLFAHSLKIFIQLSPNVIFWI
jgi:hypothetical protein